MPRHGSVDQRGDRCVASGREERGARVEDRAGVTRDAAEARDRGEVAPAVRIEAMAVGATENEPPDRGQVLGTPRAPEPASEGLEVVQRNQ
jgi:hypothetical protein